MGNQPSDARDGTPGEDEFRDLGLRPGEPASGPWESNTARPVDDQEQGRQEAAQANAQGVELLRQSQHEDAVRQFKIALQYEPSSVQILNNIGLAYAKMQDFNSAFEWYDKAYKKDPSDVETLFSLAWVERKRQRFTHAKELFMNVLASQPDHVKALYLLGDILKAQHDYEGAILYFERLVRLDKTGIDGQISLAQCYEHTKQFLSSADLYNKVLKQEPGHLDVAFYMGRVHYLQKQYKQAITFFDRIPDTDPRAFEARTYGAKSCRETDDTTRAISYAERAAKLRPHPDVLHFIGEQYLSKGDQQKAVQWFSKALEMEPNHKASIMELGSLMYKNGRYQEAEADFSRLCDLDRSSVAALRYLALVKYKLKKFDSCKQCCEVLLRLEPLNSDALWVLAELHRHEDDDRWFLGLRYPADVSVPDVCQIVARGYLSRKQTKEATTWLQKTQHYMPRSDSTVKDALALLNKQGAAVNTQEVLDVLDSRPRALSASLPDEKAVKRTPLSDESGVRSRPIGTIDKKNRDVEGSPAETADDLERLQRRAERVASRSGGAGKEWNEVLLGAKNVLRRKPNDALALKCVARSLLSTGGDAGDVKEYARKATENGDEASGFTLGYDLHVFLGSNQEKQQDYALAEKHYAKALDSKAGDETAMLGLARMLVMKDAESVLKAKQFYEQVCKMNPSCAEGHARLAEILLKSGHTSEAHKMAAKAAKLAPTDASAYQTLGQSLVKLGRTDEAVKAFEQVLHFTPNDSDTLRTLANLYRKLGKDQEAVGAFKHLLEIVPGDYESNVALGNLTSQGKKTGAGAIEYFKAALQNRPNAKEARDLYLQLAGAQASAQLWREAGESLEIALRSSPDDAELWSELLRVASQLGDTKTQMQCHRRLVQLNAMTVSKRCAFGELLDNEGQFREAREQFECGLRESPNDVTCMLKLANSYRQEPGNESALEEASKIFEQVLALHPVNTEALEGAAYCHRKSNNFELAIQLYQSCLKVSPTNESSLYYLGDILYRQHRHAECQHYLARLVGEEKCSPDYKTGALYLLAKSHVSLDEYEQAEQYALNGLELKPRHPHFLFILALVKNRVAEFDSSITILQSALECCESSDDSRAAVGSEQLRVEIHDWMAQAYERKKDYKQAMAQVDLALSRDPQHVSSLITKGTIHTSMKQLEQAEIFLKQALSIEKNHAMALVRLGYCRLLNSGFPKATQLLQRALQQRCGTVALPRSVKGAARIYMALAHVGQKDVDSAIFQIQEARKSHRSFEKVCANARQTIVNGECDGLVNRLMSMSDLDINTAQAWQLVQILAKELEGNRGSTDTSSTDAPSSSSQPSSGGTRLPPSSGTLSQASSLVPPPNNLAPPTVAYLGGSSSAKPSPSVALRGSPRPGGRSQLSGNAAGAEGSARGAQSPNLRSPRRLSGDRGELAGPGSPRAAERSPSKHGAERGTSMFGNVLASPAPAPAPAPEPQRRWTSTAKEDPPAARRVWTAEPEAPRRAWTEKRDYTPKRDQGADFQKPLRLELHEQIRQEDLSQGECLGTGGFGAVYRGTFKGAEVAIKKLFCEDAANLSPLQLEELEKEVGALKNLQHPRLVSFIGASLVPPNLCIVTEFMSGGSLHHLLHKAKTALSTSQQAKIALHVSEGVAYLHSLTPPVVHRDLKSLNIVLDKQYNAKLCDFGLTQSMDKTHISLKEGGNGGSPRYMAPELYDPKGKITDKVDVWALGCILVEVFGGPLPYDDCGNVQQILAKVLIEKACPHIPYHLHRGVSKIVEECFHFEIAKRISAQETYSRLRSVRF